jgi:hypothetical protein
MADATSSKRHRDRRGADDDTKRDVDHIVIASSGRADRDGEPDDAREQTGRRRHGSGTRGGGERDRDMSARERIQLMADSPEDADV